MPIANCVITPDCTEGTGCLIDLWAKESSLSSEHMTINFITSTKQLGNRYKIMANLILPAIWSLKDREALQVGLAVALSSYYSVALQDVHVVTQIVDSGLVVESGKTVTW